MDVVDAFYESRLIENKCELHYSCGGLWDEKSMQEMFDSFKETVMPLLKARKEYSSIGDFTKALPQDRGTAQVMLTNLEKATKYGLKRSAIVGASSLMKMQYRRVAAGVNVEFFDNQADALRWVRS
ncbi:STAS/SEC14 domain-containing protein [Erythrobacter sp. SCSIO 43205]|uniref:STAS/SEC14 domain-containing protein n=1 Tax=Erythrobacter sp. SCSIO 43205 TaxID=2779361 RepID=UPI001CAA1486|nr:STAS/SEC14 domain-containing protein [Erythrobacter sp. SCSIO 43205]UAB77520.1 STAS/SEC14 domain-containing protein [Erythrobacter sp. SCSIO 43205]